MTAPTTKNASSAPATATASVRQTPSRFSSLLSLDDLTARYLKECYLTGFSFAGSDGQELPASFFEDKIADAIAKIEGITNVDVLQREVTSERHDYYVEDYMNYAFLKLFRTPAQPTYSADSSIAGLA